MGTRPQLHLVFGSAEYRQKEEDREPKWLSKWNKTIKPYDCDFEDYEPLPRGAEADEVFNRVLFNNDYCGRRDGEKPKKFDEVLYYCPDSGVLGLKIDESRYDSELVYAIIGILQDLNIDGKGYFPVPIADYSQYTEFSVFESLKESYLRGDLKDKNGNPMELYPVLREWIRKDRNRIKMLLKFRRYGWLYSNFDMSQVGHWRSDLIRLTTRLGVHIPDRDMKLMIVAYWG